MGKQTSVKRVRLKSGIIGYQCFLQSNYDSFEEFSHYAELYNLHGRLGYLSVEEAWNDNPIIHGSVIPSDFQKVKPTPRQKEALFNKARLLADCIFTTLNDYNLAPSIKRVERQTIKLQEILKLIQQ